MARIDMESGKRSAIVGHGSPLFSEFFLIISFPENTLVRLGHACSSAKK